MLVSRVWLTDFRNYTTAETALAPGLTVVVGGNGEGKTSLLEAVGYLATLSSFRGSPTEALGLLIDVPETPLDGRVLGLKVVELRYVTGKRTFDALDRRG